MNNPDDIERLLPAELRLASQRDAQAATTASDGGATSTASAGATVPIKLLAYQVLERNSRRNKGVVGGVAPVSEKEKPRRPYRFLLRDGQGAGVYITEAVSLEAARAELVAVYAGRLLMVTQA